MGAIFAFFQSAGKTPCEYDSWNIRASGSATTSAEFCNTMGCIPSGPGDFSGFNLYTSNHGN